ncbi:MAG: EAL domain-containing protein [Rhodoferax sp.]|nr:EAL domain-containing protein [Rhodoferax sp.]
MRALKAFRLTRYFSILSFALIAIAGSALGLSVQDQATRQVTTMAHRHNEAMSQVFINELWPDFSAFVAGSSGRAAADLRATFEALGLGAKTSALMKNSDIIKVKVYNRDGLTVFSSDPNQVGENKRDNSGFIAALAGQANSALTHRDQFDSFEGSRVDVDVISSYLPIRDRGQVAGVIELYQDVTPFVQRLHEVLLTVMLIGAGVMFALYLAQLMVVRYAQGILYKQEKELKQSNRELDARVEKRTHELAAINKHLEDEVLERRRAEARLDHLAHHDPLTGLPNRLLFAEQLQRSVSKAERHGHQLAVLFIDLDRFKDVNDTLGHAVGDELLVEVARRLTGQLRGGDLLARLGGDEFVCILEEIHTPQDASRVADKLIARIAESISIRDNDLVISASIGISLYPADGVNADNLLRAADTAMYQAKKHGRNTYHFHTPEMTQYAQDRAQLERLLRHAIESNELDVHYQIKMTAADHACPSGVEALARWNSATLGPVSPVQFIPVAEETGFIVTLGEWVLRTACRQMAAWRASGVDVPRISVNLSVRQLERADIVEVVRSALDESGLPPDALELEITESVIMNADDAISVLKRLRELGVRLAVDDFGTGYSSLAYLKLLPINTLKIDRSFVIGIGDNLGDESIIQAVIGMARNLGLSTVAEGVETTRQLEFLRHAGCSEIQGYLFGKPQPADEFLDSWRRATPTPELV